MSLRARIALSAAVAVLAAVALFAVGAYWLISERAYDRLDRSLSETADRVAAELAGPDLGGRDFAEPPTPGAPARPAPEAEADTPGTRVEVSTRPGRPLPAGRAP